ncbi:MAG TPA: outer membrane beta-barrel protein [Candidatus Polarisedimenticolia bacterium]|nr:outer membrane beta-barrel protein [Candidatus Polarisedimenticolia bacterium]
MKAMLIFVSVVAIGAVASTPAHAQVAVSAYLDNNVAGDVQSGRLGLGASLAYYLGGHIGLELDGELHGHFFRDQDIADRQPTDIDLNTEAALASANVVVPYCWRGAAGTWCPYATAGAGVIYEMFKGVSHGAGAEAFEHGKTDFAINAGIGVTHALIRWVGFRVDARHLHGFVDESSAGETYPRDYGYWRLSVGVIFGGPQLSP